MSRFPILAILFQEASTLYNTTMTKKANEQPLLQELRHVLPDDLAREAETCGLLTPDSLESLLRTELSRRRRIGHLFDAADRLARLPAPPLTEAEVEAEIQAVRSDRRNSDARSR